MTPSAAVPIRTLTPGQRFALAGEPQVRGALIRLYHGAARVRLEGRMEHVEFEASDGREVSFDRPKAERGEWSLGTLVYPLTGEEAR